MTKYKIVFDGHFTAEANQQEIKQKLLKLYNNNNKIVEQFFQRKALVIKAGLTDLEVNKYANLFKNIGVVCNIIIEQPNNHPTAEKDKKSAIHENTKKTSIKRSDKNTAYPSKYFLTLMIIPIVLLAYFFIPKNLLPSYLQTTALFHSDILHSSFLLKPVGNALSNVVEFADNDNILEFQLLRINGRFYRAKMVRIEDDPLTFQTLIIQHISDVTHVKKEDIAHFKNDKIIIPMVIMNSTRKKYQAVMQHQGNLKFIVTSVEETTD